VSACSVASRIVGSAAALCVSGVDALAAIADIATGRTVAGEIVPDGGTALRELVQIRGSPDVVGMIERPSCVTCGTETTTHAAPAATASAMLT
jgi:hypothetical protein